MAGPAASVILSDFLTGGDREFVERLIRQIAILKLPSLQNGSTDIWIINGRPIDVDHHGECRPFILTLSDSIHEEELDDIAKGCPWPPKDRISFIAMCNGDVDHALLG